MVDAASTLARCIVSTRYEDIPEGVVQIAKKGILDSLGVIIAASTLGEGCKLVIELAKENGGAEEATIIPFGIKVPSWLAAFANGAMAHSLDYEDTLDEAAVHPSSTTVPAALAMAEKIGDVNGKDFITAVVLGNEIICRLGLALVRKVGHWKFRWHPTAVLGVFSATATAAKLLRLDEEQLLNAWGLALHQASGTIGMATSTGSMAREIYAAFPSKAGILSTIMAKKGITGTKESFEGMGGLFDAFFNGQYERDCLIAGFGNKFECANVSFKPWPSCRISHPYIEAVMRMAQKYDIQADQVEEIIAHTTDFSQGLCEPLEARRRPQNSIEAKFSIPFTIATALIKRRMTLGDFATHEINNPTILKIARRVNAKLDSELNKSNRLIPPAVVEIKMSDREIFSQRVDFALGHPKNPLGMTDLSQKFRDCVAHAAKPLPLGSIDTILDTLSSLEKVDDVSQIIHRLCEPV